MVYNRISNSDITALEDIVKLISSPADGSTFDNITKGLELAARYIWVVSSVTNPEVINNIPDGGSVFRRFFNESVALIANDKARTIRIESWVGIIKDMVHANSGNSVDSLGSVGNIVIARSTSTAGMNARQIGTDDLNKSLLSYAPYEVMERWIYSPRGIDDMLQSLLLMCIVYKTFYQDVKTRSVD